MILPTEPTATARAAPLALDLIRKYSIPGPRYTSYPPATKFTADLAAHRLEDAIAEDNAAGAGPLSLYFHLPFCETRCWFCGCNTIITRRREAAAEYLDDLAREAAPHRGAPRPIPPGLADPPRRRHADLPPARPAPPARQPGARALPARAGLPSSASRWIRAA
jgi:hypothetical protein